MSNSLQNTLEELKLDHAELEKLLQITERRKIKDLLSIEAAKIATQLKKLEEEVTSQSEGLAMECKPIVTQRKTYEVKLNDYAWGQSKTNVTFYINLPKVHTISKENVTCSFQPQSLELRVRGLDNKDYLFVINKLLYAIDPEKSSIVIKTDAIKILAAKVDQTKSWSHVTLVEKRASESKKFKTPDSDSSSDPTQGLMDIMRDMYNQGDDEMKRTIAKAWTESQSKGPAF